MTLYNGFPDPRGFNDWKEWAQQLVYNLELPEEGLAQAEVFFKTGQDVDSAHRLRVSIPNSIHEQFFEYDTSPRVWDNFVTGGATITQDANRRSMILSTGVSTAGARAMRQTRNYLRFRMGKAMQVAIMGVPLSAGSISGAAKVRWGYFDDENGIFFQQSSSGSAFVLRGNASGSVVETVTPQDSWNIDRLNGRGTSRITLDVTKAQRMIIDSGALSAAGGYRIGFFIDGNIVFAHQFNAGNIFPFLPNTLRTPHLPIRYEVINDGGAGSNISTVQTASSALIEGGTEDEQAYLTTASNDVNAVVCSSASLTPVLSVRLRDTLGGLTIRGQVLPYAVQILNKSNAPAYFEVRGNPTLTGAVFTNVDTTFSITEFDVAATALTGGTKLVSGYIPSTLANSSTDIQLTSFPIRTTLGRFYPTGRDALTIACRGIGASVDIHASILMRELF